MITIDMLPDDVLLETSDFYQVEDLFRENNMMRGGSRVSKMEKMNHGR